MCNGVNLHRPTTATGAALPSSRARNLIDSALTFLPPLV